MAAGTAGHRRARRRCPGFDLRQRDRFSLRHVGEVCGVGEMIEHLFHGTGPVVMAVLWTLIACSAASWGIIFYKLGQLRRARKQSERFEEVFWESKSLGQIHTQSLDYKQSPVAQVFRAGYQELNRLTRSRRQDEGEGEMELGGAANVERALRRAANQEVTRLEGALTFLATTAATAPFIGLFGTVRTLLPGACADEEDRDEGEQDEDDDRQFKEGHTGFALHGQGVGQFHSVLYSILFSGVLCLCRSEKARRFGRILSSCNRLGGLGKWLEES